MVFVIDEVKDLFTTDIYWTTGSQHNHKKGKFKIISINTSVQSACDLCIDFNQSPFKEFEPVIQ